MIFIGFDFGALGDAASNDNSDVRLGDGELPMISQANNHQESHHLNHGLANMCGDGVFCATDYLAYPSGTIDKFRLPKFSYYFWQSQRDPNLFIPDIDLGPMVFIANYWTNSSPTDVKVFSNCQQVKLYLNDNLIATQDPDTGANTDHLLHPPFTFTGLTWQAGELKAEGYIGGQLVASHAVTTPSSAVSLDIEVNSGTKAPQAGGDIFFVYAHILDANGVLVSNASDHVTIEIESGPAYLVSPDQVEAEGGIASFLLRTTEETGNINLRATSSDLATAHVLGTVEP